MLKLPLIKTTYILPIVRAMTKPPRPTTRGRSLSSPTPFYQLSSDPQSSAPYLFLVASHQADSIMPLLQLRFSSSADIQDRCSACTVDVLPLPNRKPPVKSIIVVHPAGVLRQSTAVGELFRQVTTGLRNVSSCAVHKRSQGLVVKMT
jgi:hypothetical protein